MPPAATALPLAAVGESAKGLRITFGGERPEDVEEEAVEAEAEEAEEAEEVEGGCCLTSTLEAAEEDGAGAAVDCVTPEAEAEEAAASKVFCMCWRTSLLVCAPLTHSSKAEGTEVADEAEEAEEGASSSSGLAAGVCACGVP